MKLSSTLAVLLMAVSSSASAIDVSTNSDPEAKNEVLIDEHGNKSMMPYSPSANDVKDVHQSKRELYHRLLKNVDNYGQSKKEVKVAKPNQAKIDAVKNQEVKLGEPLQVGLTEEVPEPIPITIEGPGVSETCIQSDDAAGLKLQLKDMDLNEAEVIITCPKAESELAYESSTWTYTCPGDTVCVSIVSEEGSSAGDVVGHVTAIGYMIEVNGNVSPFVRRRLSIQDEEREMYGCNYPSCYIDACEATIPDNLYPEAVAGIVYQSGRSWYMCSGSLINNPDKKLYFLTAHHCVSTQSSAITVEAFGDGVTDCSHGTGCPGSFYNNGFHSWDTIGAQLVATSSKTDATVMLLDGPIQSTMKWLGWTTGSVSVGETLHRLSHPGGRHMTYSTNDVVNRRYNCRNFNNDRDYINTKRKTGAMTGGSSGSAITNVQGQIVGQLKGSCGARGCGDCNDCQVRIKYHVIRVLPRYSFLTHFVSCFLHYKLRMLLMVDLRRLILPLILDSI